MAGLSLMDAGWLLAEDRERPMHVGGLQLFTLPEDAGPDYVREVMAATLRDGTDLRPPFDRRLARPYGRAGTFRWVPDEVDLDLHVRHLALPGPGRIRELLEYVSMAHSTLLDRHRPLWEFHLVEGLADGRVGFYGKIHHAMLDGVAAMRQLVRAYSTDPDERGLPAPWARRTTGTDADEGDAAVPLDPLGLVREALGTAVDEATSVVGSSRALTSQLLRRLTDAEQAVPFRAPHTLLDQRLTGARRFVAQSYELARIRTVADAFEVTVNDVCLAMTAGALRRYLESQGALPDQPLVAAVPVSIRAASDGPGSGGPREDRSDDGNAISLVLAHLGTHLAAPVDRLAAIHDSMATGKARLRSMTPTEVRDYGLLLMLPLLLGQVSGLAGRSKKPMYNLIVSNVPGPSEPLYWNGAKLTGLHPLSLLPEGDTMNVTQTSYAGRMEFGITAARDRLPHVQRMIDHLERSLAELEAAT